MTVCQKKMKCDSLWMKNLFIFWNTYFVYQTHLINVEDISFTYFFWCKRPDVDFSWLPNLNAAMSSRKFKRPSSARRHIKLETFSPFVRWNIFAYLEIKFCHFMFLFDFFSKSSVFFTDRLLAVTDHSQSTVSATDFIFVKICDFSTQGSNFPKTYMHPC